MSILLFFISLLCLSQSANLIRWAHAPTEVIGFWRMLGASLLLTLWLLQTSSFKKIKALTFHNWKLAGLSGFFLFLHFWTYMLSAQNTKIANCMIIFSASPLFVAVGAFFFFKEKLSMKLFFSYGLAVLGLYLLISHDFNFSQDHLFGDLMAALSALLFAVYLLSGHAARHAMGNLNYIFVAYSITTLCFGLLAWIHHRAFWGYDSQTFIAISCLILFPTFLGHALFTYLLKHLNINLMSCGKLLEPLFAAIPAYWMFGETLTTHTLWAFVLTSSGVALWFIPWQRYRIKVP